MTTKIKLPNIDTSYDYSSLVPASFAQANAAFLSANNAGNVYMTIALSDETTAITTRYIKSNFQSTTCNDIKSIT